MSAGEMPRDQCPSCRHEVDAVTRVGGWSHVPRAGGVTICAYCAALNVITPELKLRKPTVAELERYLADPAVMRAITAVVNVILNRECRN